jgi:hypothetical protein
MGWLLSWTGVRAAAASTQDAPRPVELDAIRCQMVRAVRGCTEHHRARAADQVMAAQTATDLWLLRGDLYQYLAQDLGQLEAGRRVDRLGALFEGHLPAGAVRVAASVH